MDKLLLKVAKGEVARLRHDESGVAVMFVLSSFLFLFVMCVSVFFYGENIRRRVELQNACDAASYSASVVQADGLSRMAVINRAMSWSYIQMTKMQMDYITLRWLELTRERYEKDRRNTCATPFGRMFSNKAGYHTLSHEWKSPLLWPIRTICEKTGIGFPPFLTIFFSLDCKDNTHNHERGSGGHGSYIGFRSSDDSKLETIRINYPVRDSSKEPTYLKIDKLNESIESLQLLYGKKGARLEPLISAMKSSITTCNALLPLVNRQMTTAIEETAVRTLYENLPRNNKGNIDEKLLNDYHWMVAGGVSRPPVQYPSGIGGEDNSSMVCKVDNSYFSGLNNTEEDEIIFLNMADGLPKRLSYNGQVCLIDYFSNADAGTYSETVAAGLDQWFVRCNPSESAISDRISIKRDFSTLSQGIVRAYKNANYEEGASKGGAITKVLGNYSSGILRGNYITDFSDTISGAIGGNFRGSITKPLEDMFNVKPSDMINPGKKPKKYKVAKRAKWRIKTEAKNALNKLDFSFLNPIKGMVTRVGNLAQAVFDAGFNLDVEPSCNNMRYRFIDQCANVRQTTGLVSEYEWASAYWFCHWLHVKIRAVILNMDVRLCRHPFLPMAAAHGGRRDAEPNNLLHTANEKGTDAYIDKWDEGVFGDLFPWLSKEFKMFKDDGKSRNDYRSSFISIDCDMPQSCDHNTIPKAGFGGKKSNYIIKGFVRIYGDDRAVYNSYYQGVPARPWILNRKYFEGAGSIVVGIARKQRNIFADWLFDDVSDDKVHEKSLYSAFTPVDERQHFVAFSVARAGFAPRVGGGMANGSDSVNLGVNPSRRYEVRYDSVLDKKLGSACHPVLPDANGLSAENSRIITQQGRIGCVCGNENTTKRLRRQWNLSQTDWDGILLPLRYAHAGHSEYDSISDSTGEDQISNWDFLGYDLSSDSVSSVVGSLIWDNAVWRNFVESDGATGWAPVSNENMQTVLKPHNRPSGDSESYKTGELLPLPSDLDDAKPADLFRRRRIL